MKLIADGGSTKTDWRLLAGEGPATELTSGGINPFHMAPEEIDRVLGEVRSAVHNAPVSEIWYYGAGLIGEKAKGILAEALTRSFGACRIFTGDDMLGASRALLGHGEGIACILGTGSNSCLYRNGEIVEKIPALGYILGDEGSGTDIGKRFINALFKRSLPPDLTAHILREEGLEMTGIITSVYRGELPARYLASFAKTVKKYLEHEAVAKLVEEAFESFIEHNVSKYTAHREMEIAFTGSVAVHFRPVLEKVLKLRNLKPGRIIPAPIDELAIYHK
ncbi:MAG: ATPase [Bacteroidota bacterium]